MSGREISGPGKVLVTGGNGNLGRLVASELEGAGTSVIAFDLPGTTPAVVPPGRVVVEGDIRDTAALEQLVTHHRPEAVIHLASLLSGSSEANPSLAWEVNATASLKLMDLARTHVGGPFLFASTIATYGPGLPDPLPGDAPQWPDNIYGATKVAVERAGYWNRMQHGLDFRCLRFPMVLSPFAPPGAVTAYPGHAFRAAVENRPFTFPVQAETGMSTLFLMDVVHSIVQLLGADATRLRHPAYNLHSYTLTAADICAAIHERYPQAVHHFDPDPRVDGLITEWPDRIDDSTARADWDWQPRYDVAASAAATFDLIAADTA